MATYKVLQDIEADDKLFGPLSLKQFIFAAIAISFGVTMFFILSGPLPLAIKVPLAAAFLPPIVLFGFLAAPLSKDQPTEVWLLARISFLFKPHKRIWNQDGISELVTITAPRKVVHVYTDGMSQSDVKSRLQALANTVDSRGWAVKNVNTNLFSEPSYLATGTDSDRLISPMSLPQDVPITDVTASDDILDIANNSTAQHLDQLVQESTASHRNMAISGMQPNPQTPVTPSNYWFMNQGKPSPQMPLPADYSTFGSQQVVTPGTADIHPAAAETAEEHELAERFVADHKQVTARISDHMKVVQPLHDTEGQLVVPAQPPAQLNPVDPFVAQTSQQPAFGQNQDDLGDMATTNNHQSVANPAILGLAQNDDLNVSTIARQAKRLSEDDGEVVISLH